MPDPTNVFYGFLYTLIFLDTALFLTWAATIFYLYTECPSTLFQHALFALYFIQTLSLLNVLVTLNEVKSHGGEQIKTPIYWLASSLIVIFFSLTLFLAQFAPDPPFVGCSSVLLYQILSGTGLCISLLSCVFWTILRVMYRRMPVKGKRTEKLIELSDLLSTV